MNGKQELTIEDKIAQSVTNAQESLKKLKITAASCPADVELSTNLTPDQLRAMSEEEIGIHAITLQRYSLFVQQETNKAHGVAKLVEHCINLLVGKNYSNYGDQYTKFDVKKAMVLTDNDSGKVLNKLFVETSTLSESFNSLAYKISSLANSLIELQKTKRFSNKEAF